MNRKKITPEGTPSGVEKLMSIILKVLTSIRLPGAHPSKVGRHLARVNKMSFGIGACKADKVPLRLSPVQVILQGLETRKINNRSMSASQQFQLSRSV